MGYPLLYARTTDQRDDARSTNEGANTVANLAYSIPPFFLQAGSGVPATIYHLVAAGEISATSATPPTFTMDTTLAGVTANLAIAFSALTALASGAYGWTYEAWFTCRAVGAGTTVFSGVSLAHGAAGIGTPTGVGSGGVTALDSTTAIAVGMTTKWSAATTGNISNCKQAFLELCHA
jgi:hypothetical protein